MVFGLSGVGKSVACADFVRRHPSYAYLRASQVLSEILGKAPKELAALSYDESTSSQEILGRALAVKRRELWPRSVVIDAHSIIDTGTRLVEVPVEVVEWIAPTNIVFLQLPPSSLHERRSADVRPRVVRTIEELEAIQETARRAAYKLADAAHVPLMVGVAEKPSVITDLLFGN